MARRLIVTLSTFVLIFLVTAVSFAQQSEAANAAGNPGLRNLGKTLALNLTTGPGDNSQGFTIMTADGDFMLNSVQQNEDGHSSFSFQGNVQLTGEDVALVRYNLSLEKSTKGAGSSQDLHLGGSAIVRLDSEVVIASSKDRTFKLRISVAK